MQPIILIFAVLVLGGLLLKEFRRANRANLVWRLIASAVAVVALTLLVIPVDSPFTKLRASRTAVLITEGAGADSISRYKQYPQFRFGTPAADSVVSGGAYDRFVILGFGAFRDDLSGLTGKTVDFRPAALSTGVTAIAWNRTPSLGQPVIINGTIHRSGNGRFTLLLLTAGVPADSVSISGTATTFSLRFTPKAAGKLLCRLLTISGTDTLANDPLPVVVKPATAMNVLLLNSSPGFETRFLKNWLGRNGFSVSTRAQISKAKYSTAYLNTSEKTIKHLTPAALSAFDVVITDRTALNELPSAESGALSSAVSRGTGIIIMTDSLEKQASRIAAPSRLYEPATKDVVPVPLVIDGKRVSLVSDHPIVIQPAAGSAVILRDARNRARGVTSLSGKGKITLLALPETFPLQLSGDHAAYETLWSRVIGRTARQLAPGNTWRVSDLFGKVGMRQRLVTESADGKASPARIDGVTLAPRQDFLRSWQWTYDLWPVSAGWKTVTRDGDPGYSWYVFDGDDWKTRDQAVKLLETRRFQHEQPEKTSQNGAERTKTPIHPAWFMLLFVLAAGLLWAEAKFQ